MHFFEVLYKQETGTGSHADELTASIRSAMLGTAAIEVGAVGLGKCISLAFVHHRSIASLLFWQGALAALASFDWTGLAGASLVGLLGLYVIPMRRSTIKRQMKERIDRTRLDLIEQLRTHFLIQVDLNERQLRQLVAPYV
jgi:hypothetical protein